MHKKLLLILIIFFCFSICLSPLIASDHSKKQVTKLIKNVEKKLDKYNEAGAEKYAGKEIGKIEDYIKKSKAYLDEDDYDEAYYEAGKADAYFKLIDSKKELLAAENEYKSVDK